MIPGLVGPEQAVLLERLEQEYANLQAAMQWSLEQGEGGSGREMALRLAWALGDFWDARGLYREGRAFLEQALVGSEGVAASVRAKALYAAGNFVIVRGDTDLAEVLCQESLILYREVGDTQGTASCLMLLASIAQRKGTHLAVARSLLEESLALGREMEDKWVIAWSLFNLAHLTSILGEYSTGIALFEESLAVHRELGNKLGIANCIRQSAMWLFWARGDQATIRARLEESLMLFRELGNKYGIGFHYWLLPGRIGTYSSGTGGGNVGSTSLGCSRVLARVQRRSPFAN